MNGYARPSVVMSQIAGLRDAEERVQEFVDVIEEESRVLDNYCRRTFFGQHAVRYAARKPYDDPDRLSVYGALDIASLSEVKADLDDDATFETTLVEGTDFHIDPEIRDEHEPGWYLTLDRHGEQLSAWPTYRRGVRLTGIFGYSFETEDTGDALTASMNSSVTTMPVGDSATHDVGDTLVIGSEQMHVTARGDTDLTVVRGINGSTAAAHDDEASILRRRYPRPIERFVAISVVRYRWQVQTGRFGAMLPEEEGPAEGSLSSYYAERKRLAWDYRRVVPV